MTLRGDIEHESGLTVRNAKIRRARAPRWAWDKRLLLGSLNLQIGEEGIGKGNLTAWIAARITKGELPGDLMGKPGQVAFVGDEDAWDHIWVPRLKAAGADLRKAQYISAGTSNGGVDVRVDADALRAYIESEGTALMYFDQLLDNLGLGTDTWKDKSVRDALAPLRRVAQDTKCALLGSMHPNKRQGSFRDRISGTPAFNALSRSSLLVAHHPEEPGRIVVVRAKGNYSEEPRAFEFRIRQRVLKVKGLSIPTSYISSIRESDLHREDLLEQQRSRRRADSLSGQARKALAEHFADGQALPSSEVIDRMLAEGFPKRTTQAARSAIGLKTWKEGYQGRSMWGHRKPTAREENR